MSITLSVANVEKNKNPLSKMNAKKSIEALLGEKTVESCSSYNEDICYSPPYHSFVAAAHMAFDKHYPLCLSPDIFWLLITQGFAKIVNNNSEQMRKYFISHEGKKEIEVVNNLLVKGKIDNPWSDVFDDFSQAIEENIGTENHRNIVVRFSTTGKIEKAANEVVLMDSMQSYFDCSVRTLCGIPEIMLEGEVEDWKKLLDATQKIMKSYKTTWFEKVIPLLSEIVETAKGKSNSSFWNDFYKLDSGSGGPYITGWIVNMFPYLCSTDWNTGTKRDVNNTYVDGKNSLFSGITHDKFPSGLSSVPFKWKYFLDVFDMTFIAGFTGVEQNEQGFLRPKIGWAVC